MVELEAQCPLGKSAIHQFICFLNRLEKQMNIWNRK